jgi:hypothetical protein
MVHCFDSCSGISLPFWANKMLKDTAKINDLLTSCRVIDEFAFEMGVDGDGYY